MFEGLLRFLGKTPKEDSYTVVVETDGGAYIKNGDEIIAGPYNRPQDAKGQLTRMRRSYTAGARRPVKA